MSSFGSSFQSSFKSNRTKIKPAQLQPDSEISEKDIKFAHTEQSFSNSFVSRSIAIGQAYFCVKLAYNLYSETLLTNYKNYTNARVNDQEYTQPENSSVYEQIKVSLLTNDFVYLICLFGVLFGQINQKRYRFSFYASVLAVVISILNCYTTYQLKKQWVLYQKTYDNQSIDEDAIDSEAQYYAQDTYVLLLMSLIQAVLFSKRPMALFEKKDDDQGEGDELFTTSSQHSDQNARKRRGSNSDQSSDF